VVLLIGGAHAGSDSKDSGCGSNTAIFIEHIKSLLPNESSIEKEFQQVRISIVYIYVYIEMINMINAPAYISTYHCYDQYNSLTCCFNM